MDIKQFNIQKNGFSIPTILITPEKSYGAAVIIHGYGGCKEEILGLAWRIAKSGITACVIDQCGHGENTVPLEDSVLSEVDTSIQFCRKFGKVAAVGHSSGGRFALTSCADFKIGISPALASVYKANTRRLLDSLRDYRVIQKYAGVNYDILGNLPEWTPEKDKPHLIIFGSRDIPEIITECRKYKDNGFCVIEINKAMHNDIYLLEETFSIVTRQLVDWIN
jgi:dienelactone hydrolase